MSSVSFFKGINYSISMDFGDFYPIPLKVGMLFNLKLYNVLVYNLSNDNASHNAQERVKFQVWLLVSD